LADPTRLRLLSLLLRGELCVCELVDALRIPQYTVSRHLRRLRTAGLVEARRSGRWMHYRIARRVAAREGQHELLGVLETRLREDPAVRQDHARLTKRLSLRRFGQCVVGTAEQ
jgi:ArsR family transcriptional regulator, arsenate/arsenite/antimonite-responsive transcriptional repressor